MPASATALTSIPSAASAREPRRSAQMPASGEEISIPMRHRRELDARR